MNKWNAHASAWVCLFYVVRFTRTSNDRIWLQPTLFRFYNFHLWVWGDLNLTPYEKSFLVIPYCFFVCLL